MGSPGLHYGDDPLTYLGGRVWISAMVVVLAMGILLGRLWQLQLIEGSLYSEMARKNRVRTIRLVPARGKILDCQGKVLADNRGSFAVSVIPSELTDPWTVIEKSSPVLGITPERMRTILEDSASSPRFMTYGLMKNVSLEQVSLLKSLPSNLEGVTIETRPQRVYGFGRTACHVMGTLGEISSPELDRLSRIGYRSGDLIGKSGIEKAYETYLRGMSGWERIEIDAKGRQLASLQRHPPMQGADVVLTIQADLQQFIEEAFIYRAGSVVVLEPQTGRVLALFSKPGFDLNLFSPAISRREWEQLNSDPLHPLENRAIRGLYSPASSFKLVVAAAALAEKAVEPSEQLTCEGVLEMGEQSFRCWKRTGHGSVDLRRAIVESCDIYFYKLGLRLGPDIIARHALLFGFGKPTGLGLPQELPGLIPTPAWKQRTLGDSWKEGETVTMSIGQGYVVSTPIQMAAMTAAIANGGDLMKPAIVQGIRGPDGRMVYRHVPVIKQKLKLSRQSLTFLQQSMKEVVSSPRGTGKQCRLPDLQVAGKTGTSQVIRLRQGSEQTDKIPYHERTHAIFVGYVDDMPKQIALAVVVEHGGKGGSTAAPLARRIIAHYYGLSDIPATPVSGATD